MDSIISYKHIIPKLIWTVLGLLMLALGVWCAVELVQDYFSFPSYTELSSEFVNEYHLPAITICNVNLLNRTKMEEDKLKSDPSMSVYDLYKGLLGQFTDRAESDDEESKGVPYERMNNLNVHKDYTWDILSTLERSRFTFAKERLKSSVQSDYITVDYTEMGSCLEINDNQLLVQRVNGPVGGLSMILDAKIEDYLESTEAEGFYVVLRMANESVISKEYAFAVSPGKEWYIQLETKEVTRLGTPYGNCEDDQDIFVTREDEEKARITDHLTIKECFTSQVLWKFMNEPQCQCYPWYVYSRHIARTKGKKGQRNEALESQLYNYFTTGLPEEKRINFDNNTCFYQDEYSYSGTPLATINSVAKAEDCATHCRNTTDCVVFMWAKNKKQCDLFDSSAVLTTELEYRVTRGEVNCTLELEECSITTEAQCENLMIDTMMDVDNTQKPMDCHEPCSYNKTTYSLSFTNFPSAKFWETTLSASFPHYKTVQEAQRNLVKLVFYQ